MPSPVKAGTGSGFRTLQATRRGEARAALPRASQSGQSLVEVVVAAALMGVGIVTGLTALATAQRLSSSATQQARDICVVRTEAQFIESAPWDENGNYLPASDITSIAKPEAGLQVIRLGVGNESATVYKAQALSPTGTVGPVNTSWCDQVLGQGG